MESERGRRREKQSLESIPEHLVPDIISRMQAKDLMRFNCVSKSWRSLISTDPSFATLQMQRTLRTASFDRPYLLIERHECGLYDNYWVDLDSIEDRFIHIGRVHNPFDDGLGRDAEVLCSCHGLLVLQQHPSLKLAVSNPTTKTHRMVPPNPAGDANFVFCGFGYDNVHDCYKLVTMVETIENGSFDLMVYDLNKNTWRTLQSDCLNEIGSYVVDCADDALYWCVHTDTTTAVREMKAMVCFVLAEEEFHEVEIPDFGEVKYHPNMSAFEGRLCLVCEALDKSVVIWSVDMDCGNDGKRRWVWTKLLAMSDPYVMLPSCIDYFSDILIPVCFSACKKKILIRVGDEGLLFRYDIGNKRFYMVNNPVNSRYGARSCVQSLVGVGIF